MEIDIRSGTKRFPQPQASSPSILLARQSQLARERRKLPADLLVFVDKQARHGDVVQRLVLHSQFETRAADRRPTTMMLLRACCTLFFAAFQGSRIYLVMKMADLSVKRRTDPRRTTEVCVGTESTDVPV